MRPKTAKMQVIERKMYKRPLLVRDIGTKILPTDNIEPVSKPTIQFSLHYPRNLAILLRLGNATQIGNLFY